MPGYWEQRQLETYKAGEMQVNQYFSKLEKAFNQTKRELQKTVESFYWRYAEENGLSYAAAQTRLNKAEIGELKDFIELSMQNIGKYNQTVNNLSIKARMTRYQALEAQVDAMLRQLYAVDYEAAAGQTMREVYGETYNRTWYNIDQYRGFHSAFAQVNPYAVEKLLEYPFNGANFSSRLWKQKDHLQTQLMESLTTMMVQGKNPQTLTNDFAKKMNVKKFDAYRLLHTESSFLMSEATHAGYREDGVEKYQILATLDSKTCDICGDKDGEIYEVGKEITGENMPPFHCFCRCTDVPYYDDDDLSDQTRVARDPETEENVEVPADMTYREWYNTNIKGNLQAEANVKMNKNRSADMLQYEKYKDKLGNKAPETFDKFQKLKYNDINGYNALKETVANQEKADKFLEKLHSGDINTNIKRVKQQEHVRGTKAWRKRVQDSIKLGKTLPSIFYSEESIEALVQKYKGTGIIDFKKNQEYPVEYITADHVVGKCFNTGTGKYEETKRFAIRYSSKGVHLHPVKEV